MKRTKRAMELLTNMAVAGALFNVKGGGAYGFLVSLNSIARDKGR